MTLIYINSPQLPTIYAYRSYITHNSRHTCVQGRRTRKQKQKQEIVTIVSPSQMNSILISIRCSFVRVLLCLNEPNSQYCYCVSVLFFSSVYLPTKGIIKKERERNQCHNEKLGERKNRMCDTWKRRCVNMCVGKHWMKCRIGWPESGLSQLNNTHCQTPVTLNQSLLRQKKVSP